MDSEPQNSSLTEEMFGAVTKGVPRGDDTFRVEGNDDRCLLGIRYSGTIHAYTVTGIQRLG
jgi:hypothetical protein